MDDRPPVVDGPDFSEGVPLLKVLEKGTLAGHADGNPVLVSSIGGSFHAVSGLCTHYGAPLSEGLVVENTVRCPWHHACFDLQTGAALKAPAFDNLQTWKVELEGNQLFVREIGEDESGRTGSTHNHPDSIVIVGGGAAGFAAADTLRKRGFKGSLIMLSDDVDLPCDRPNLSKDFLDGSAPEEWIPLKPMLFYQTNTIDLRLNTRVARIDVKNQQVIDEDEIAIPYDALLLATGAEPLRLKTPGLERENVHTLRSVCDARSIIADAENAQVVAVIGASFIGLEVAASLRKRGLDVHVIAPDEVPLAKILGEEIGTFVRRLHEEQGVIFHLGRTVSTYDGTLLTLDDTSGIVSDFVVMGVGVKPRTELAEQCGLATSDGILVNEFLETSAKGVYAAGDIASFIRPGQSDYVRIEHWVVAERQGQIAAMNMLGERQTYDDVPFFWTRQYDTSVHYVGHAPTWDDEIITGSIQDGHGSIRYYENSREQAYASINLPDKSMIEEARFEEIQKLQIVRKS